MFNKVETCFSIFQKIFPVRCPTKTLKTQAIAMAYEEGFPPKLEDLGFVVYGNPQFFLEVPVHPEVVVPHKIKYGHPGVGQTGQGSQGPGKAFGDYRFVFEPEIEEVPQ